MSSFVLFLTELLAIYYECSNKMSKTNTVYRVYQPSEVAANLLQGTLECGTPCHSLHTETKQTNATVSKE